MTEVSFFFFLSRGFHRTHKERFLPPFSSMCKYVPSVFCQTIISLHSMRKYNLSFLLLSGLLVKSKYDMAKKQSETVECMFETSV